MHAIAEEPPVFLNGQPPARPMFAPAIRLEKASPIPFVVALIASVAIFSACVLFIPFPVQDLEYGVESADQSVEIDLVAAMPSEVMPDIPELEPEPIEPIAEIAPPDQPSMVDTGDFIVPEEKIVTPQPSPEPRREIARKPPKERFLVRPVQKVAKAAGDGSSPNNPGKDKITAKATRGAAVADLAYLRNPEPRYPRAAQDAGQQGVTRLMITVDESGRPIDVQLVRSSGWSMLDDSALSTVQNCWRFKPRPGGGTISKIIPIRFELTKKRRG